MIPVLKNSQLGLDEFDDEAIDSGDRCSAGDFSSEVSSITVMLFGGAGTGGAGGMAGGLGTGSR